MPFALWLSLCGFPIHGWAHAHSLSLNKHEITLPSRKPCILSPFRPGFSSTQKSPRKHALTCALPKHSHTPFFLFPNARNAPNRMSKECTCIKCRGKSLNPFACPDIQYSFLKPILYQKKNRSKEPNHPDSFYSRSPMFLTSSLFPFLGSHL